MILLLLLLRYCRSPLCFVLFTT